MRPSATRSHSWFSTGPASFEAHPDAPYPAELWNDLALPEGFASEGHLLERSPELIHATTREFIEAGGPTSARAYLDACERRRDYRRRWELFFQDVDVLLTPSMPFRPSPPT